MPDIRCAFDGHVHRADICDGDAVTFLRTPKGTLWPLCAPCNERHKKLLLNMVGTQLDYAHVIATSFDIPILDVLVEEFRGQDPDDIRKVLARADAMHEALGTGHDV